MRTPTRSVRALLAALAALGAFASLSTAQSVATTPVGAVTVPAQANSETYLSMPLSRAPEFVGVVGSVSGDVVTVSGTPDWAANQFVKALPGQPNTYYARVRTGALAGQYFTVVASSANSVTLDPNGFSLSELVADDRIEITPYWSLGSLFPASAAGTSFTASANAFTRQTELFFPNLNFDGINAPSDETFFFTNGAWRKVGANVALSFDDRVIPPDVFFKVSNKAAASSITVTGQVEVGAIGTVINSSTVQTDNVVAISFPADVTLNGSGLFQSGAFTASPNSFLRTDELLVYSDAVAGTNRPAVFTYFYTNGAWRRVGAAATTDFSNEPVFAAAKGVIIRKAATPSPTSVAWAYTSSVE